MEANKPVYVTAEGLKSLQDEFDELVNIRRPALAKRLHTAIKQGDLSENADYITAKEEQGFLEGRIRELKARLRNAELIDSAGAQDGIVDLGCEVTVVERGYDENETYHIVGATEADPSKGKISNESPLGRALIGHQVGDEVAIRAPAGEIHFQILDVK
jgi:transcription elongation factor GreA